jgi:hypothetical protein
MMITHNVIKLLPMNEDEESLASQRGKRQPLAFEERLGPYLIGGNQIGLQACILPVDQMKYT